MSNGKQRHGCLTTYLILIILANSVIALMYLFGGDALRHNFPSAPGWAFPLIAFMDIVNVVCAVALFRWKKWGFFGFFISGLVAFFVNLMVGIGIGQSVLGLVGVAVLYGVLHIGKDRKGWPQLD